MNPNTSTTCTTLHTQQQPAVMEKFRLILEGFSSVDEPPVFILMGNFSSAPMNHTPDSIAQVCANFDALGNMIAVCTICLYLYMII
jgi:hypothetical protein